MPIDWSKLIQTRDGRRALFLDDKNGGQYCSHRAIVLNKNNTWEVETFRPDGGWRSGENPTSSDLDLINVPEKQRVKMWINLYPSGSGGVHNTHDKADSLACSNRIACLEREIEYTVGEGLGSECK